MEPIPKAITQVLKEYKGVMPPELPKHLLPRREVDHKIELKPGDKPPIRAHYQMLPQKLKDLQKQIKELLDAICI